MACSYGSIYIGANDTKNKAPRLTRCGECLDAMWPSYHTVASDAQRPPQRFRSGQGGLDAVVLDELGRPLLHEHPQVLRQDGPQCVQQSMGYRDGVGDFVQQHLVEQGRCYVCRYSYHLSRRVGCRQPQMAGAVHEGRVARGSPGDPPNVAVDDERLHYIMPIMERTSLRRCSRSSGSADWSAMRRGSMISVWPLGMA